MGSHTTGVTNNIRTILCLLHSGFAGILRQSYGWRKLQIGQYIRISCKIPPQQYLKSRPIVIVYFRKYMFLIWVDVLLYVLLSQIRLWPL